MNGQAVESPASHKVRESYRNDPRAWRRGHVCPDQPAPVRAPATAADRLYEDDEEDL